MKKKFNWIVLINEKIAVNFSTRKKAYSYALDIRKHNPHHDEDRVCVAKIEVEFL